MTQRRHHFLFGCGWSWNNTVQLANHELDGVQRASAERRAELCSGLFNCVTLPFYWRWFEKERGKPSTERLLKAVHWAKKRGFTVKGHPLCWHETAPRWTDGLSNAEVRNAQLRRIEREVGEFRGLVDEWDVFNEGVIMPIYPKYENAISRVCREGRLEFLRQTFAAAREADPNALLVLNDFDTTPNYESLIQECLESGVPVDVIGIESHMHWGYWGRERTEEILDRFARFGLPIEFTENTLVSGELMPVDIVDLNDSPFKNWPSTPDGEERQANEIALHYQTLMSHPSVRSITYWQLDDNGGWLDSPGGLIRRDLSAKPAYERLRELVYGTWWLKPTKMCTDAAGRIEVNGFFGDYELTCDGRMVGFQLRAGASPRIDIGLESSAPGAQAEVLETHEGVASRLLQPSPT